MIFILFMRSLLWQKIWNNECERGCKSIRKFCSNSVWEIFWGGIIWLLWIGVYFGIPAHPGLIWVMGIQARKALPTQWLRFLDFKKKNFISFLLFRRNEHFFFFKFFEFPDALTRLFNSSWVWENSTFATTTEEK